MGKLLPLLVLMALVGCEPPTAKPLPPLGPSTILPVRVETGTRDSFWCSGVQVHQNWALTAAHCVDSPMWVEGLKVESQIIPNADWDMMIMQVPGLKGRDVAWTTSMPKVGDVSKLIGWGCSAPLHDEAKAKTGVVESIDGRDITYDVAVCQGDSGGPVYDQDEHLIGLIVRMVASNHHAVVQYLAE
jgi:V8-like Glu-specific endopeptidase